MAGIELDESSQTFLLTTPASSYALSCDQEASILRHLHWGAPIDLESAVAIGRASDVPLGGERLTWGSELPLEYVPWGGQRYDEPSLKVDFPDATRGIEWRVSGHSVKAFEGTWTLGIELRDTHYPLWVDVFYRIFDDADVIERWARVRNVGDEGAIVVRQAHSANWCLRLEPGWRARYLQGGWGSENQLSEVLLQPGKVVIESRRGTTSHECAPWFSLDPNAQANETTGEVFSGSLAWSGSWKIVLETTPGRRLHACGGLNDFDAPIMLEPHAELVLPVFAGLYSSEGFGGASRAWHHYQLRHVLWHAARDGASPSFPSSALGRPDAARTRSRASRPAGAMSSATKSPDGPALRPVLYNSWEATWFAVSEAGQAHLAELAAEMGIELFVVDDGWFTGRRNDHAGLGDWFVDKEKFPEGLGALISKVNGVGMAFGLWVEPEMVNPDSALYRAHPDWVLHFAHRTRTQRRNQLVLNLARDDVADFVFTTLDRLLSEYAIDFVKWDMNRHLSEPGWPDERQNPERVWLDYTRNLYTVLDRLRAAHPNVDFESCSGGGGRVDLGILARVEQVWTSDNTDALDRILIQEGFSQAWTTQAMMAWVTDSPNPMTKRRLPLRFRFHVAMAGSLGIGGNLAEWSDEERAEARELVETYKAIRPTVQLGHLYRLASIEKGPLAAREYVSADGRFVVAFAYSVAKPLRPWPSRLRLAALDPAASYRNLDSGAIERGAVLMQLGVDLPNALDVSSMLVRLERVET